MKSFPSRAQASRLLLARHAFVVIYILALSAWGLLDVRHQVVLREAYARDMAQVHLVPPSSAPEMSQESIDIALAMFSIDIPPAAEHPHFDKNLKDRGITSRSTTSDRATVAIGPAAFASWSLLGSTLAHEIEVHCRQDFMFISIMDSLHLEGTAAAERQAYAHELRNAQRFGLTTDDTDLIKGTMDYYYSDPTFMAGKPSGLVRSWLARNLLEATEPL